MHTLYKNSGICFQYDFAEEANISMLYVNIYIYIYMYMFHLFRIGRPAKVIF